MTKYKYKNKQNEVLSESSKKIWDKEHNRILKWIKSNIFSGAIEEFVNDKLISFLNHEDPEWIKPDKFSLFDLHEQDLTIGGKFLIKFVNSYLSNIEKEYSKIVKKIKY